MEPTLGTFGFIRGGNTDRRANCCSPGGTHVPEHRFCFCPSCSDPFPGGGKRELSPAQPANAIAENTRGSSGFSLQASPLLCQPISLFLLSFPMV